MSKFKVRFQLKQHTPIIHFQSNQPGATLRATELKPKFDKFLKEYAFEDEEDFKKYFIQGQKAFDYKVKIVAKNITTEEITQTISKYNKKKEQHEERKDGFPSFFATMGNEWKKSPKFFSYTDTIEVEIISLKENLLKIIKKNFPKFILETNFGTRQSKGFGSFSVTKINDENYNNDTSSYYTFEINLNNISKDVFPYVKYVDRPSGYFLEQKKLFTIIDIFYKTIRSGINLRGKFYFKSLLFMYAKENQITWDKKIFKDKFLDKKILNAEIAKHKPKNEEPLKFNTNNKYLVRDLLGLATTQEWMSYKHRVRHPKTGNEKDRFNNKNIEPNKMERFKSPITIKPIKISNNRWKILIILSKIPESVFKQSLTILYTHDEGFGKYKKEKIDNIYENLEFWKDFNLEKYFNFIENFDMDKHIDSKYDKHPYTKLIKDIYQDLKATP